MRNGCSSFEYFYWQLGYGLHVGEEYGTEQMEGHDHFCVHKKSVKMLIKSGRKFLQKS